MFHCFDQGSLPVQLISFGNSSSSTVGCKAIFNSLALVVYFESFCWDTSIHYIGVFEFLGLLLYFIPFHEGFLFYAKPQSPFKSCSPLVFHVVLLIFSGDHIYSLKDHLQGKYLIFLFLSCLLVCCCYSQISPPKMT